MTRFVEWDEWKSRRSQTLRGVVAVRAAYGRAPRTRPRSDEERSVIVRMALAAMREQATRLERIGPREYVLHPRGGRR